jgi:hypothetical protein
MKRIKGSGIGIGMRYKQPGYPIPTHKQMDEFERYDIAYDVDEQLRDAVIELNNRGFKTGGSCSGGHKRAKGFPKSLTGYITIHPSTAEYRELADRYPEARNDIWSYARLHGASDATVDIPLVKKVIQRYIGNVSVRHEQPSLKFIKLFHTFTFPKLT